MGFVLDTNILITAIRDAGKAEELERFYDQFLPFTFLHATVAQELLAGAIDDRRAKMTHLSYIEPFERRNRLVVPSYAAWKRSGEIISRLVHRKLVSPGGFKRSFPHDVLLAASCRELGHTLVTTNLADFELIGRVEPFDFVAPYPEE